MASKESLYLLEHYVLGSESGEIVLPDVESCRLAVLRLSIQARRTLDIFSYDLDAAIYDQNPFVEVVKNLAIRSPQTRIRILLQSNERVQQEGHRLIQLWRRLSSKIELRRPQQDYIDHPENFLLADATGYMHLKTFTRHEGVADFNAKLEAGRLGDFFTEVWERSEPESDLRDLHI